MDPGTPESSSSHPPRPTGGRSFPPFSGVAPKRATDPNATLSLLADIGPLTSSIPQADTSAASGVLPSQQSPASSVTLSASSTSAIPTAHVFGTNLLPPQLQSSKLATTGISSSFGVRASAADGLNVTMVISVVVGKSPNVREFYIHESLATKHSGFFATAAKDRKRQLGGDNVDDAGGDEHDGDKVGEEGSEEEDEDEDEESQPKWLVRLKEDDPELFEMFARFLYSGKVYSRVEADSSSAQVKYQDKEWPRLVRAWRLGDKLQSLSFKDAVVDTMCEKLEQHRRHHRGLYQDAYPHTTIGAPLRRLIVDIAVWCWSSHSFEETEFHESWNQFFRDLALRQHDVGKQGRKGPAPFKIPSCNYHEHGDDSPCYKTMF